MVFIEAKETDLQQVVDIEAAVMSTPWSYCHFHEAHEAGHCIFLVAKEMDEVAGYVLLYLSTPEAELPDIVVSEKFRHMGVGKGLLSEAIKVAKTRGITDIFLEVRETNEPAKALYTQFGFQELGIRKNFYSNPTENAICMKLSL